MRQLIALAIAALSCGFSAGAQFDLDPVANDGAGGIAFDGSTRCTIASESISRRLSSRLSQAEKDLR